MAKFEDEKTESEIKKFYQTTLIPDKQDEANEASEIEKVKEIEEKEEAEGKKNLKELHPTLSLNKRINSERTIVAIRRRVEWELRKDYSRHYP